MFIRPRYHDPTTHSKVGIGYLPRWVWWPYNIAKFCYNFVMELFDANVPGVFKLMIPLVMYNIYHKVINFHELDVLTLAFEGLILLVVALATFFKMRARGDDSVQQWRILRWQDDDYSHYHKG